MFEKKIFFIVLTLISISLFSCDGIHQREGEERAVPVKIVHATEDSVTASIRCAGQVSVGEITKLSFKTGGIISNIPVDEGDRVTKGQLLARLDPSEIQARVNQAKVAMEKAQRDYERALNLYDDDVATLEQLQNAQSAYEFAEQDYRVASFNLRHSEIRAPSEGSILKRLAEERELIGQGMPVFVFGSSEKNWVVRCGVVDRDIVRIEAGDSASIEIDAYPGEALTGYVTEVGEAPDPNSGIYEIGIILDETELKLVTGLIAEVRIFPRKREPMKLIPIDALVRIEGDAGLIFVPDMTTSTAVKIGVEVKEIIGEKVALESGLDGVDRVITDGAGYLTDGAKIRVIE